MARANAVGAFFKILCQYTNYKGSAKNGDLTPLTFFALPAFEKNHSKFIHLAPIAVVQC